MSSTTIPSKTRRFLPMLLLAMLLLLIAWTTMPAFAQENTGISRTQWQIHEGIPPEGKNNDIASVVLANPQDLEAFSVVNIPMITDTGWISPTADQLDENKDISIDVASKLVDCNRNVDFTYFQTMVTIPKGVNLTDFEVTFGYVDDNARIYVFNSDHKDGDFIEGSEIRGSGVQSANLLQLVKIGDTNRVVIAQVDTCADKNTIKNIQIKVTGTNAASQPLPEYVPEIGHNALYVDKDAKGKATGVSWTDAYTNVQDALAAAKSGAEIWVAEGVYYPDVGGGKIDNTKSASFTIPSGVALYGGFVATETLLDERDWRQHVTVLSGDIDQNDGVDANGVVASSSNISGTNSLHVVYLDGTTTTITGTTFIDGFVITAGQADGVLTTEQVVNGAKDPADAGGGLLCNGNRSPHECSPTLMNVTFSGNFANGNGGAMFNDGRYGGKSNPTLTNVIFSGNSAKYGGALYNYGGRAEGGSGGDSSPRLTNVIFSGNSADFLGGAILNQGEDNGNSSPTLTNVTFSGNQAKDKGGAIYNYGTRGNSSPMLTNVILWNNSAPTGPSIYNLDNATATIKYSIVQSGAGSIAGTNTNSVTYDNETNMDSDPQFMQPIILSSVLTSTGGLRLQEGSPAIDKGDNSAVSDVSTDLAGHDRIMGNTVDLGAYEFQVLETTTTVSAVIPADYWGSPITKKDLRPGDRIEITATGTITITGTQGNVTPAGQPSEVDGTFVCQSCVHYALIAKIGQDGAAFTVGTSVITETGNGGPLYFSINESKFADGDPHSHDNGGSFTVTIRYFGKNPADGADVYNPFEE